MAKTKISEFSATPGNNTDIDGINIAEGCAPSGINDAIRELMAQLKDWQAGTSNDPYVVGSSGSLTLSYGTANGVPYLNGSKVVTSGSALTFDGTNFATTGSVTSAGSSNSGNLAFTGTGNRITGDFSNATVANRVAIQTSTANSSTVVGILPNGTGTTTALQVNNNSDLTAALAFGNLQASSTEMALQSGIRNAGSYLPMTFYTGGSERMRVDTSGNVGIGTSSPAGKLTLGGSGALQQYFISSSATAQDNAIVSLYNSGTAYSQLTHDAAYYTWKTSGTERARIDSSGNLLVGTTSIIGSATGVLQVKGAASQNAMQVQIGTNGNNGILWYNASASAIGSIVVNSGSVAYNTTSDYRLKENIAPMTGALEKVSVLKPVTYTWKATGESTQGFIAHELQEVCPDAVSGKKDAVDADGNPVYQGIDTSFLVATLTAAIQELKAINDAQAETITALTARVTALETN